MYETNHDDVTYITSGNRVYEVTSTGIRLHHTIKPPSPPASWWRRQHARRIGHPGRGRAALRCVRRIRAGGVLATGRMRQLPAGGSCQYWQRR